MARQTLNYGAFTGDQNADSAREGAKKIDDNFVELYAGVPHARLDIAAPALSASFRDDGAGNLGWYAGAAGAADGAQIKVATIDKATGFASFTSGLSAANALYLIGSGYTFARLEAGDVVAQFAANSLGNVDVISVGNHPLRFLTNTIERVLITSAGNVGIGTSSPLSRLSISTAGYGDLRVSDTVSGGAAYLGFGGGLVGYVGTLGASALNFQTNGLTRVSVAGDGAYLAPSVDNVTASGRASFRWTVIYAATGTINTSDAREKTPVRPLNAAELRAAQRLALEIGVYQWLEAVAEKGDAARQHVGMTVQRAIEIMEEEGLDPWAYGFMCRDQITRRVKTTEKRMTQKVEEVEVEFTEIEVRDGVPVQVVKTRIEKQPVIEMVAVVDENGEPVIQDDKPLPHPVPVMVETEVEIDVEEPAGDRLGFRPDQLDRFIMRGLAEKIARLEA